RRLCDSRSRFTAGLTVGAYAERLAGRLPGGIRASVAPAQSWRDGCAGCFLPSCLFRRRRSGGLHGGRRFRRRQRNDQADGRTSTWPDSRKCFSRDPHQSAGVFVGADRHHGFRAHSLGPSTAGISCVAFDPARQRLTIVGAGPAGLTAAIAAAQHGLKATVLERGATPTPAGGGIVIHSNGLLVLERLRLLESLKPLMAPCRRLTLQLGNRHELVSDDSQLPIPNNYFAVVLRHQFQGVLLEADPHVAPI